MSKNPEWWVGDTFIGRMGDACLSADCFVSDIASFLKKKNNIQFAYF